MQRCAARGVNIFRFNSEDYPQRIGLELNPLHPESARLLLQDGQSVNVGAARGVWLRRPQWPVISDAVTDKLDHQLAAQEAVAAAGGLWCLLANKCVSPPDALQAARWKLPQLELASRIGLAVPVTIVTTSRQIAEAFLAEGPAVIKAVQDAHARRGTEMITGLTERIDADDLHGIDIAPVLLQREVEKVADYRVTVVGRRIFAAKTVTPAGSHIDVRGSSPADCLIENVKLPDDIEQACLTFAHESNLRYAAFDFAKDADGTIWFLECNPNGQWGWIEVATGAAITDAIVEMLLDPVQT